MPQKGKTILHTTWFGSFLIRDEKILDKILFPKDAMDIANRQRKINQGEVLKEEKQLAKDVNELFVTSKRLKKFGETIEEFDFALKPDRFSYNFELLQKALQKLGMIELKRSGEYQQHLVKAVNTIQDLNETINILSERLRDWYSTHFPELEENVNEEEFIELISRYGHRDDIQEQIDSQIDSIGMEITEKEKKHFISFANLIKQKKEFRSDLWAYVDALMKEIAPTITKLSGSKLGSELIAAAGSLKELAKMPSSTIQVLGAEKALFRHLNKGSKPPKHGLILQHPHVHKSDDEVRGKIARTFANKIAIAARIDYFSEKDMGEQLKKEFEKRVEKIKKS